MNMINRVLAVLVLVLAVVAVFLEVKLGSKRKDLKGRGDQLATEVNAVSKEMDKASGTNIAVEVTREKMENMKDVPGALAKFKKQASEVMTQRNALSEEIASIASSLRIPDVRKDDFSSVGTYAEKNKKMLESVASSVQRNDDIVDVVKKSGDVLGSPVDEFTLKSDNYKDPLKRFSERVVYTKEKQDKLESHASEVSGVLGFTPPKLDGEDYKNMLQTSIAQVKTFKNSADQTYNDLNKAKKEIKQIVEQMEAEQAKTQQLTGSLRMEQQKAEKLNKTVKELNEVVSRMVGGENVGEGGEKGTTGISQKVSLYRKLEGKVIEINPKWGFVVINLGKNNKIEVDREGRKVEENAILPVEEEMVVARDLGGSNQYVGKIKISKVLDVCSIANVVPESRKKLPELKVGDIVYFAEKKAPAKPAVVAPSNPEEKKDDKEAKQVVNEGDAPKDQELEDEDDSAESDDE